MLTIRVGNIKDGDTGVYVGRGMRRWKGSALGNPFTVAMHGRAASIAKYREWLDQKIEAEDAAVMSELRGLGRLAMRPKGVTLLCWCTPLDCHAGVILEKLRAREASDG